MQEQFSTAINNGTLSRWNGIRDQREKIVVIRIWPVVNRRIGKKRHAITVLDDEFYPTIRRLSAKIYTLIRPKALRSIQPDPPVVRMKK